MAITQDLAHAMQGMVSVTSVKGKGSQFVFAMTAPILLAAEERATADVTATVLSIEPPAVPTSSLPQPPLLLPPVSELAALLDMALKGELPRLRKQIEPSVAANAAYQPFVDKLLRLLDVYDEEGVVALLQSCQAFDEGAEDSTCNNPCALPTFT